MSNIENLLRRQYEGNISPEELSELERLTHREQVIETATRRAKVIRRRHLAGVTGVASVLIIAGFIVFVYPSIGGINTGKPMVAKTEIPEIVPSNVTKVEPIQSTIPETPVQETSTKSILDEEEPVLKQSTMLHPSKSVSASEIIRNEPEEVVNDIQPTIISDCDPIVACNTACSPDSVINDIWKFLRT